MSLSTTDRIKLRQISSTLKAGQDVNSLNQEDKSILVKIFGTIGNTDDVIANIQNALNEYSFQDAIVDAAILKSLTAEHAESLALEASQKSADNESQKEIDKRIYKHIIQTQMMKKIREVNAQKLKEQAARVIVETDIKAQNQTGLVPVVTQNLTPTIDKLITDSGFTPTPSQRQQIYERMTVGVIAGTTDPTDNADLVIAYSLALADIGQQQNDPIAQRLQVLTPTVDQVDTQDIQTEVTSSVEVKKHDQYLTTINQQVNEALVKKGFSPSEAQTLSENITPEVADLLTKPDVTPQEIDKFVQDAVNKQSDKKLETAPQTGLKGDPDSPTDKQTHQKITTSRTSYSTTVVGEIAKGLGHELTADQARAIAANYVGEFQLGKLTQEQAIDSLAHQIQKETGLDIDLIKKHIEDNHANQVWAVKRGFNNQTIINIPLGVSIKIKESIEADKNIQTVLRQKLEGVEGISQKDIDRLIKSKQLTESIAAKIQNDQELQISIRKVYVDALYTNEQKQIYKALFVVYGDQIKDRPTNNGQEAITVISAAPAQTTISATTVALASMGVTTKMLDDILTGKVKNPEMEKILKNHFKELAHIRKELDALEGSKLYKDIAPSFIEESLRYSKRDSASILVSLTLGESSVDAFNKYAKHTAFQMVTSFIPDKYINGFYKATDIIFHPIDAAQDYLKKKSLELLSQALLKGQTLKQFLNALIAKGLAKLGLTTAVGLATGGIGFLVMAGLDMLLKPLFKFIGGMTKGLWGEELKARDLLLAPIAGTGILISGLSGVFTAGTMAGTLASNGIVAGFVGLILYIIIFTMAPLLSTIVHLESGVIGGSAVSPYTGPIIDGCNAIWPMSRGSVIQGPRGTFSHTQVEAIDIATPVGTQVVTISSGRIIFNDYAGVYGNLVKVESTNPNGGTYEVWYAHLAVPSNLSVNDTVNAGDPIAISGATSSNANFANPHLHLEYRRLSYNQCPAGGVPVPNGCYGFTNCGSILVR